MGGNVQGMLQLKKYMKHTNTKQKTEKGKNLNKNTKYRGEGRGRSRKAREREIKELKENNLESNKKKDSIQSLYRAV